MATANLNPISSSPQFTLLHGNWKAALHAANSFLGRDAEVHKLDSRTDRRAKILLAAPALNLGDVARKFSILEHYLCIGSSHAIVSLAIREINSDFKSLQS